MSEKALVFKWLNKNSSFWYHTRNMFVLVPLDIFVWNVMNGSGKVCTNDQIIVKIYIFPSDFLIVCTRHKGDGADVKTF